FLEAGLIKYVVFSDTVSDMPALYNTADLVIFPVVNLSGKFDVPLVIVEAYACGRPVILSDLDGFQEFTNEHICVTILKDSGEKLIESVAHLKENVHLRENIGYQARLFAEKNFDLENTAREYEKIYSSL
ncbi:MAG: glycosyltransferase, partial [Candidatus Moraniibacteriota bacterium]